MGVIMNLGLVSVENFRYNHYLIQLSVIVFVYDLIVELNQVAVHRWRGNRQIFKRYSLYKKNFARTKQAGSVHQSTAFNSN